MILILSKNAAMIISNIFLKYMKINVCNFLNKLLCIMHYKINKYTKQLLGNII